MLFLFIVAPIAGVLVVNNSGPVKAQKIAGRTSMGGVACFCTPWQIAPGVYSECIPDPGEGPMPECGSGSVLYAKKRFGLNW
jgi:hypothetical protein